MAAAAQPGSNLALFYQIAFHLLLSVHRRGFPASLSNPWELKDDDHDL
jgi:hypothetical protein